MRVTLVVSSLGGGGAERVAATLARGFHDRGHRTAVVTLSSADHDAYALPAGVARVALGLAGRSSGPAAAAGNTVRRLVRLRRAIVATAPDAVISFVDTTNVTTIAALAGARVPVVVTEHVDPTMYSPGRPWAWLRRRLYPFAAGLVSVSRGVDDGFRWLPAARRAVIDNPLPPEIDAAEDAGAATPGSPSTVVAMGRLVHQKGHDLLIRAFAKLGRRFPDWSLLILGEGPERAALEDLAGALGVADRVRLAGHVDAPFGLLRRAGLFVLASRFEGFGIAVAEAMACGLPVIAADCPSGPSELIDDGVTGVLVAPGDVDALAAAMARLMADGDARRRLGARAREASARFRLARVMDDWEALLAPLAAADRRPAARIGTATHD